MEEQLLLYQQVIDSQQKLRKSLQTTHSVAPQLNSITPQLLDVIDLQITLLNELIIELKQADK